MSSVKCFMVERTNLQEEDLRRFTYSGKGAPTCRISGTDYHTADVVIAHGVPYDGEPQYEGYGKDDISHDDPRWPKSCECGYAFRPEDQWQHNSKRLHRAPDGKLYTQRKLPPGSMWFMDDWGKMLNHKTGPDGHYLYVMLPDGQEWAIDGEAKGGGGWTRTGSVPNITARPSILTSKYHGFLTDGVLTSC